MVEDTYEEELMKMQSQVREASGVAPTGAPFTPPDKVVKRKAEVASPERTPCSTKRGRTQGGMSHSGTTTAKPQP